VSFKNHPVYDWSYRYCWWMRVLAIPYVFECVWRSFLWCQYNNRQTLIDSSVNSVLLQRCLAFVGEISWGIQLGWGLRVIGKNLPLRGTELTQYRIRTGVTYTSYVISSFAFIANCCSLTGTITSDYAFPTAEESLWASLYLMGSICAMFLWHFGVDSWSFQLGANCFGWDINPFVHAKPDTPRDAVSVWVMRVYVRGYALFGLGAFPYMVVVDIPTWYNFYVADQLAGKQYFGFVDGINNAASFREPTQNYALWANQILFFIAYFTFACQSSIWLMFAPGRVRQVEVIEVEDGKINVGGPILENTNGV